MTPRGAPVATTKAFCVGQAKSGTASLYGLLRRHHRAAHEPERERTLDLILREARGELDQHSIRDELEQRDQRLSLDYDIAWANQFLLDHLLTVFPDATFIVLIRDPYTWLQSMVGHLISRQIPPDVRAFLDWWFKPAQYPHSSHDRVLETHGVYSIEAYARAWNRHVKHCTQVIPPTRRLILKTHAIKRSHRQIADFLKIPEESLDAGSGHLNRSTWKERLDSLVDRAYLEEVVGSVCGDTLTLYFPEVAGIPDTCRLSEPAPKPS